MRRLAEASGSGSDARQQLVGLLLEQGNLSEAFVILRHYAHAGDHHAGYRMAWLLRRQGSLDEAIAVLRRHTDYYLARVELLRGC